MSSWRCSGCREECHIVGESAHELLEYWVQAVLFIAGITTLLKGPEFCEYMLELQSCHDDSCHEIYALALKLALVSRATVATHCRCKVWQS
jgi:hypothetical protein